MPLQTTSGAASYDAFGGGVAVVPTYIEDVFSCFLYTGNGSSGQSINNGIDLSTKGGLVWIKDRANAQSHALFDTIRGTYNLLSTNNTTQQVNYNPEGLTAFNTTGFSVADSGGYLVNTNTRPYASWTFRKQPKFFDVVTYTGNGVLSYEVPHNLQSVPGCIIWKRTDSASNWGVWHIASGITTSKTGGSLNATNAFLYTLNATPYQSATTFQPAWVNDSAGNNGNISGATYVAYLFAHDAGGFGLTGTDNVISCGSYTANGNNTINLGYEPQFILLRRVSSAGNDWELIDTMRGASVSTGSQVLYANSSAAEGVGGTNFPTATGFFSSSYGSGTIIYIAIRRGPMKVPTDATKVFSAFTTAGSTGTAVTTNFPVDFQLYKYRAGIDYWFDVDRLRGVNSNTTANSTKWLDTTATTAEASATNVSRNWGNTGFEVPGIVGGGSNVFYSFRRAPSFFDEVCYTGTGSALTVSHNLAAVPELIIGKNRTTAGNNWPVLFNFASTTMNYGFLNLTNSCPNDTYANVGVFSAAPTSTSMFLINSGSMNTSANNHVAYLFATCAGVSKVFSYTGNGSSQTINCGFTAGARFVLIKRINSSGNWYVWDTARGIVAGNDPHLNLNDTAAEVTSDDTIDTDSTGFVVNQVSATDVNVSSATYIGLAIA